MEAILTYIPVALSQFPVDRELLQYFLMQPGQDVEWLRFVTEGLVSCPAGQREVFLHSILKIECCSWIQNEIINQYQCLFYQDAPSILYIPPRDVDLVIRTYFELMGMDFNQPRLSELLMSFYADGAQSRFYWDVLQSDAFRIVWERQQTELAPRLEGLAQFQEYVRLENRMAELEAQNALLRHQIANLGLTYF